MSRMCLMTDVTGLYILVLRLVGRAVVTAPTASDATCGSAGWLAISVIVEHPELGEEEVEEREGADDQHEQPCHGGGVTHVELGEALLVQVQRVEHRRVGGPSIASRDDERLCEGLERADDLEHQVEEDDRAQERHRDVPELRPLACTVHRGSLVVHVRDLP